MIPVHVDYATPSAFESDRERALLGLAASARRPVRFHGLVARHLFPLRIALRALGEAVWSDDSWLGVEDYHALLDPVVTVHPDRLFFEAFSQDQSAYALVIVDPAIFETEGEVRAGTTNVDFTAWLWAALGEMRTSCRTHFRIEAGGFEVKTAGAGGRFERKVELPDSWVRGFLQLQAAMAMPGTRLSVRPVDLLAAIRFLRYTKAKVSPRALRYVFEPGRDARIVLEPWEEEIPLVGAAHGHAESRTIRTWGRRRLKLIEPLLPFADSVEIYLKGRALPNFYSVKLPGVTFVLGLTGWTSRKWTERGSFDMLSVEGAQDEPALAAALDLLARRYALEVGELAESLGKPREAAFRLLARLVRSGRAMYDVESRRFRHRELFEEPIDEGRLYPPDPRREKAASFTAEGKVCIHDSSPRETVKARRLPSPSGPVERRIIYRDWAVSGSVADSSAVEIVVNDAGQVIFGTCACEFFKENLLNKGPCEHMVALLRASEDARRDLPTSLEVSGQDKLPAAGSERGGRGAAEDGEEEGSEEGLDGAEDDDAK